MVWVIIIRAIVTAVAAVIGYEVIVREKHTNQLIDSISGKLSECIDWLLSLGVPWGTAESIQKIAPSIVPNKSVLFGDCDFCDRKGSIKQNSKGKWYCSQCA